MVSGVRDDAGDTANHRQALAKLRHIGSGKVREIYEISDDVLLIVASDRISAFDVVLPTEIPDKGAILTALSVWWLDQLRDLVPNHLLDSGATESVLRDLDLPAELRRRSTVCRRLDIVPLECVARGYVTGSAYGDYQRTCRASGHQLPAGLANGSQLDEPIFTPATKAPVGHHDQNISIDDAERYVAPGLVAELQRLTLAIYERARRIVEARGLTLVDTKLEYGHDAHGVLRVADEVLTPDSSRFWMTDHRNLPELPATPFDKQVVRDWLIHHGLAGTPASLPDNIVELTRARYVHVFEQITGTTW